MPKQTKVITPAQQRKMLHKNLSFQAAEAYKLLRANLQFTLPGNEGDGCLIFGVTSSTRGEGKSTTAINLSYTLAETGKRVLLVDCDMRLPSIGKKMEVANSPGLSNALVAPGNDIKIAIRPSNVLDNWKFVASGDIPPNPSELLGSHRMRSVLKALAKEFDYIVLDLPPVNLVSDALVVSPLVDGMIVAVREGYAERKELRDCIRQLGLSNAKVLGIVMTDVKGDGKRYGKYRKKYYYSKYYYSDHHDKRDSTHIED